MMPQDHTPFGLLNLVMRGMALGTLSELDFLHLGSPRLVATYNPCQVGNMTSPKVHPVRTISTSGHLANHRSIDSTPTAAPSVSTCNPELLILV